jgi:hypothetical protein
MASKSLFLLEMVHFWQSPLSHCVPPARAGDSLSHQL